MSADSSPCPDSDGRFARNDMAADAVSVATVRDQFSRWLRYGTPLDETKLCDVILAVNEALANSAEFAYLDGSAGTVDLEAVHDPARRTLTVTVSDRGRWRDANPLKGERCRGRGITLMRALADSVIIDTSGLGTSVCMRFGEAADLPAEVGVG